MANRRVLLIDDEDDVRDVARIPMRLPGQIASALGWSAEVSR